MDRFIVLLRLTHTQLTANLKSNMDRFIAEFESQRKAVKSDLKSNMDRFIVKPNQYLTISL